MRTSILIVICAMLCGVANAGESKAMKVLKREAHSIIEREQIRKPLRRIERETRPKEWRIMKSLALVEARREDAATYLSFEFRAEGGKLHAVITNVGSCTLTNITVSPAASDKDGARVRIRKALTVHKLKPKEKAVLSWDAPDAVSAVQGWKGTATDRSGVKYEIELPSHDFDYAERLRAELKKLNDKDF